MVAGALVVALAIQGAVVAGRFGGHPSGLFRVGPQHAGPATSQWLGFAPYVTPGSSGYDGQYFLFLAYDPFLRQGVGRLLDVPGWRARRIGYPLAAWAAALGIRPLIAPMLYAVNLAAVLGCVALLARRMRAAGLPPLWGGAFVLLASTFMTLTTLTCEGVATCAVLLGFLSYERDRPRATVAASLAAVMVKEVCLLWVAALAVGALARRRGWLAAGCAAVVAAYFLWGAYADARLAPPNGLANGSGPAKAVGQMQAPAVPATRPPEARRTARAATAGGGIQALAVRARYFTWPLAGAVRRLRIGWSEDLAGPATTRTPPQTAAGTARPAAGRALRQTAARALRQATEAGLMLTLLALGVQGIAGLRRRAAWSDPSALLFALCGATALCLGAYAWSWSGDFARQLYLLPAVALWRLPSAGRWGRALLAAHVAFCVLRLATVLLLHS